MKDYDKYQIEDALSTIFNGWNERMLKELLEAAYCECKSLQSRLEKAEKDSKMLDWLESSETSHGFCHSGYGDYRYYAHQQGGYKTVREVIDTAMQSAKESQ